MKTYLQQLKNKFGYRATWEPNLPLKVGYVGKLHKGAFQRYTSLEEEGIPITIDSSSGDGTMSYSSEGGVSIMAKGAADVKPPQAAALGDAEAGFIVSFSSENAVVFKANNTTIHSIGNLKDVEKAVIEKANQRDWDPNYVIVTQVIEADSATVIISNAKDAKMEIKANGDLSAGDLDIANADAGLEVVAKRKIATEIIGRSGLQPLYKVMGIKKKFFGGTGDQLQPKHEGDLEGELLFEEMPFDDEEVD